MDFENDIKCFVVRKSPVNNDDTNASNAAENNEKVKSVIQITSSPESSVDETPSQLKENSNDLDMSKQKNKN